MPDHTADDLVAGYADGGVAVDHIPGGLADEAANAVAAGHAAGGVASHHPRIDRLPDEASDGALTRHVNVDEPDTADEGTAFKRNFSEEPDAVRGRAG